MSVYLSIQTKISDKLQAAETKLETAGYVVVRHVRGMPTNECFGLSVFGETFYELQKVRNVIGYDYKVLLNIQMQEILIR